MTVLRNKSQFFAKDIQSDIYVIIEHSNVSGLVCIGKIRTVRLLTRKYLAIDENWVDVLLSNLKCWMFCQLENNVVSEVRRELDGF